jgi:Asp/Glu/hydantoin racemase
MKVTQDDLLDALRDALAKPVNGDGTTAGEMADAIGRPVAVIRKALRAVASEGRLEVVMVTRSDLTGRQQTVPAYRIKPKPKAKR